VILNVSIERICYLFTGEGLVKVIQERLGWTVDNCRPQTSPTEF